MKLKKRENNIPTYSFQCMACHQMCSKLCKSLENSVVCDNCGGLCERVISTNNEPIRVMETASKFHGIQTQRGLNEMLEKRSKQHYIEVEAGKIREQHGHQTVEDAGVVNDKGDGFKKEIDEK